MVLLRALARAIGTALMLALALVCLGVALYCLDALISLGSIRPDRLLHLPTVRRHVGHFLAQLAAPGSTAALALAGGVVAVLIGLVLLIGVLRSGKERLLLIDQGSDGTLAARPRTVRMMAQALAEQASGATSIKRPKLKLSRRGTRGRMTVNAASTPTSDQGQVRAAVTEQLKPLTEPFHLRTRVRLRTPALAYLVRLITIVLGLALVWYGAMVILLAVKVAPHTVNSISAYRTLYHDVAGLKSSDFTTAVRLIAGFGGFLAFLLLFFLALQELPRPYLARGPLKLADKPEGETTTGPRAIERLAAIAAQRPPAVAAGARRRGDISCFITSVGSSSHRGGSGRSSAR